MLATFVIFLREGIEASMIVAILLAALERMGHREHFRDVFVGVGAALVLVLGGGVAAYLTIKAYAGSRAQTVFETVTYLVAAVVLTYMTLWMRVHAATLSSELRARAADALDGRTRWGLGLLAFQAVGREGLETMVFTLAIVFASSVHGVIVEVPPAWWFPLSSPSPSTTWANGSTSQCSSGPWACSCCCSRRGSSSTRWRTSSSWAGCRYSRNRCGTPVIC